MSVYDEAIQHRSNDYDEKANMIMVTEVGEV